MWLRGLILVGVLLLPTAGFGQEASLSDFFGEWRGMKVEVSGDDAAPELPANFLDVQIRLSGSGFRMVWNALRRTDDGLTRREVDSSFVPTDRPGVYAFDAYQGTSFFGRLFAAPATGNPLEGQVLLWARLEAATLIVYGLSINPAGGYDIHRHAWTLTGQRTLSAEYVRRTEEPKVLTIQGALERVGG